MELKIRAEKTSEKRLRKQGWEYWYTDDNKIKAFYKKIRGNGIIVKMFDNKTIAYVDDRGWWIPELWFLIALCDELKKLEENN